MIQYTLRILKLISGFLISSFGIVMTMKANLGFAPWDLLHQGIANSIGLTIGRVSILAGFVICIICFFLGEKLGLGTILDMLLVGLFIDIILQLNFIPKMYGFFSSITLMITGLFFISFGVYLYISTGFCAGPRDSLMVAIERKTGLAIGICKGTLETSVVLIGWLLGGPVGIGTILSAFGISIFIQIVFSLMKFDPTKVQHETLYVDPKTLLHKKN